MSEREGDGEVSRLLFPPVKGPIYQKSNYHQLMTLINSRKNQYEQELSNKALNSQERNLSYVKSQTDASPSEDMLMPKKESFRDQMLARGSIFAQLSEEGLYFSKRPKLLKFELGIAPQKINIINTKPRLLEQSGNRSQIRKIRFKSENSEKINRKSGTPSSRIPTELLINLQLDTLRNNFILGIKDLKTGGKTNERLERVARDLEAFNPFFRKIQRVISVCLLRIGRIIHKYDKSVIYEKEAFYSCFYIVLTGTVKLKGENGMQKICQSGETILEEIMLAKKNQESYSLQGAKAVQQSYLLQIQKAQYERMQGELIRFGFKQGAHELQTMLKRNNIVKNWVRSKFKLINKI